MKLYKNIKKRREELNITQDELAVKMGYKSRSTIAKIESGINDIPQSKIKAFADVLETTPSFLMGWTDEDERRTAGQDFAKSSGKFIKATREAKGMNQEELASKAGISIRLLESLESDFEKEILMSDLEKIAKVFNIDPWEIVNYAPVILDTNYTETHKLVSVYKSLSDKGKEEVINFAQYTLQKEIEEQPILTIAAHKDSDEWTEDAKQDIENFKKLVKGKNKNK